MRTKLYPIFLHVALIALAATTLAVVHENRRLVELSAPAEPLLEVGSSVEAIAVYGLDGLPRNLAWDATGANRLLLVFTTSCPACKQNQEAWRALHLDIGADVEVVGISLSSAEATLAYRDDHDLPFDVVVAADREAFAAAYEIQVVPFTVLLGRDGRVDGVWQGVLSTDQQTEVTSSIRRRAERS